jgi:hypothetical protein
MELQIVIKANRLEKLTWYLSVLNIYNSIFDNYFLHDLRSMFRIVSLHNKNIFKDVKTQWKGLQYITSRVSQLSVGLRILDNGFEY